MTRDAAMTALILGFFASAWSGWAQEKPPVGWTNWLIAGSVVSLAIALVGGILAWRHWSDGSVLGEPGAMRRYGIIVGIEFATCLVGALALGFTGQGRFIAVWIAAVVGVHFWPMVPLLANNFLVPLGVALLLGAGAGLVAGQRGSIMPSAVTGAICGCALIVGAAQPLVRNYA